MEKGYSYEGNVLSIGRYEITFIEEIEEIVEFDKCIVVCCQYSDENPRNNAAAFDYEGNALWEIDDVPWGPHTATFITKKDDDHINIQTFMGQRLCVEAYTGELIDIEITK